MDTCDTALGCQTAPLVCDDGDACTTDSCDTALGCQTAPVVCDDGDACTEDSCDTALGCQTAPLVCDDGDACTEDSCDTALGCQTAPLVCDDGNACTTDSCDTALGCQTAPLVCDDGNVCTTDSCDSASGCQHANLPGGTSCSDGDLCNGLESCWSGTCEPGQALDCDDGSGCTNDSCDSALGCQNTPIGCDDGDACTADSCDDVLGCQHAGIDCDDASVCTVDSCDTALGCQNTPISCDDGDICTVDSCDAVQGCQNGPISCDDGDACTVDSCDAAAGCQYNQAVDGTSCEDAEECNGAEICIAGTCTGGSQLPDGTPCGDGNPCNGDDSCLAGACLGGTPPPEGTPCSDGDACNGLESCFGEVCTTVDPLNCDDGNDCTADSCDQLLGCANDPIPDCGNPIDAVMPLLECVDDNGDGTFTAYFGYRNDNAVPVTIPIGPENFFAPPPEAAGQPVLFEPGRSPFLPNVAFTVDFDGSPLLWTLEGPDGIPRTSTASSSSSPCPYFDVGTQSICYRALRTRGAPKPEKTRAVHFEDPFQEKLFDITDHKMVCTPASVVTTTSVTSPIDPNTHTGGRKMWRTRTQPPQPLFKFNDPTHQRLQLTDAFGTISIDVKRDYRVLVETAICDPGAEICPVDASVLDTSGIDTDRVLSCYRVQVTPGTPRFEKLNFLGSDRFQTQAYRVTRPRMLCALASKEGGNPEAITDPTFQLCYRLFVANSFCEVGSPPEFALQTCRKDEDCGAMNRCVTYPKPFNHQRIPDLQMNNEFGPETLQTFYEEMICLDATVAP